MEGKKISFSFMKTRKVEKLPVHEKKDFIECVEEKSIKVVGGDEVKDIAPLVIPMKPNTLITTERLKQIADKVESALVEPETVEAPKSVEIAPENETLDQMAVRELLEDSKKEVKVDTPELTLTLPAKSMTSGEKESTIDDYESVPIQEFGLAMLRGMGWTKTNEKSTFKPPQLRPKGLGLGADKVVKDKQKVTKNSKDEELTIVKNAYVKITNGKYSGYYGKVLSLDEDNGRVMVDITVKKETVSLSEFMMHPVTKSEFDKESKVINAIFEELYLASNPIFFVKMDSNSWKDSNSFEQYKKNEGQKSSQNSEKESSRNTRDEKSKQERDGHDNNNQKRAQNEKHSESRDGKERNRDRSNTPRDTSREKYSSNKNKRASSQDSLSDSDSGTKRKSKRQYSSMESLDSDTEKNNKRKEKRYDADSEQNKKREKERRRYDSDSDQYRSKINYKESKRQDSDNDHKINKKDDDRRRNVSYKNDEKERRRHNSESEQRINKKSDKERRRHDSDSESDHRSKRSDTEGKRDIDKKRKGKKKKRDRDRSPNYRKHRK